ncbi:hypothetical protein FAIPA1_310045 [Frankia sp. AiPs1]|uniref:FHA domain-containing protein n=1 Tax=Frankia sp. AiPa1 TaxID=573492 RepID=UPI00202B134D|nr:FHA domain-containing protein [Frankia sp. AiPa1]MCL9759207.1 FHA domain-containing protein [Frankia sp. AiPa1]
MRAGIFILFVLACGVVAIIVLWRAGQARHAGLAVPDEAGAPEPMRILKVTVAHPIGAETLRSAIEDGVATMAASSLHPWPWPRRRRPPLRVAVFTAAETADALGGHGSVLGAFEPLADGRGQGRWLPFGGRRGGRSGGVVVPRAVIVSSGRAIAPDEIWLMEVDASWQPPDRRHTAALRAGESRAEEPGAEESRSENPRVDASGAERPGGSADVRRTSAPGRPRALLPAGSAEPTGAGPVAAEGPIGLAPEPVARVDPALEARQAQDRAREAARAALQGELERLERRAGLQARVLSTGMRDEAAGRMAERQTALPPPGGRDEATSRPTPEQGRRRDAAHADPAALSGAVAHLPAAGEPVGRQSGSTRRRTPPSAVWLYRLPGVRDTERGAGREVLGGLPAAGGVIGRSEQASITIREDAVSSRHARITPTPKGWSIQDLDSRNGTYVNGERVVETGALASGDVIRLGMSLYLQFIVGDLHPDDHVDNPREVRGRA